MIRMLKAGACAALLAVAAMGAGPGMAGAQDDDSVSPISAGDFRTFPAEWQSAYIAGALQATAYIAFDGDEVTDWARCIAAQAPEMATRIEGYKGDQLLGPRFVVDVTTECQDGSLTGNGRMLTAKSAERYLGRDADQMERALFVVGVTDVLYFYLYSTSGPETGTCIRESALKMAEADTEMSEILFEKMGDPAVENLILIATIPCIPD